MLGGGRKKCNIHKSITESSTFKRFPLGIQLFPCVQGSVLKVTSEVWQSFTFSLISTLLPITVLTNVSPSHMLRWKCYRQTWGVPLNKCRSQHFHPFNCIFPGIPSLKGTLFPDKGCEWCSAVAASIELRQNFAMDFFEEDWVHSEYVIFFFFF